MRPLIALVLLSLMWLSEAKAQAPGGWYTTTIRFVYAGQQGGRISVAANDALFAACGNTREFVIDPANPYLKQMLMMIMTAYVTGKPINLHTTGQCVPNGILLTDVWLLM